MSWPGRCDPPQSSRRFEDDTTVEEFRGLLATSTGGAGVFQALITDTMGALVDQASLQDVFAVLVGLASPHVTDVEKVALAVGLVNADRVWEGDPRKVGGRNSGRMRMTAGEPVRAGGDFLVTRDRLTSGFGDLGADLVLALLQRLRNIR